MQGLSKYILEKAKEAGICKEWAGLIAGTDSVDGLLQMYVKGIDFCLSKDFPSNADLTRLGGSDLGKYGLHIDEMVNLSNNEFIVLLGKCEGTVNIDGFTATQLFVKHTSFSQVTATGNSFIMIDCFDDSVLSVQASGNSKVVINVYGSAQVSHNSTGDAIIKIVHKNKATY